jgi:epsilon-lactone hydrolase
LTWRAHPGRCRTNLNRREILREHRAARDPRRNPADLSGLPPLIIQGGTHEVLLDDALRLARQAATADVAVTLDITPRVPHVFQAYYPILDEAAAALDRAGQFLSAQLSSAERVTA